MTKVIEITGKEATYSDIIFDKIESFAIVKDKVNEKIYTPNKIKGFGIRVFKNGQWREASTNKVENKNEILDLAKKISRFIPISKEEKIGIMSYKPWKIDEKINVKISTKNIDLEEKLGKVRDTYKETINMDPRITNVKTSYYESEIEKIFINSEGSELRQIIPRTRFMLMPIAKKNSRIDYDYLIKGGIIGYEVVNNFQEEDIEKTVKSSLELLEASEAPSGELPIILSPSMTGTFAHESFGHGCEADQVIRGRSYLINYLGKKVANENFNLYDDGTYPGGYGTIIFDDEGIKPSKTVIVENGVLKNFLHDRITSKFMDSTLTGNSRRESYMKKPFVRMTNTYVGAGDYNLYEMISEIKNGVITLNFESGMEDPMGGGMQLKAKKGFLIKNGVKTKILSNLAVTGFVLAFVANIDAISKPSDFEVDSGNCGKGHEDYVPVGSGGPFLRSKAVVSQG
jgi:TldD protein